MKYGRCISLRASEPNAYRLDVLFLKHLQSVTHKPETRTIMATEEMTRMILCVDQNFPDPEPEGGDICKVGWPVIEFQGSPPPLTEGGDQTRGGDGGGCRGSGAKGARGAGGTPETGGARVTGGAGGAR